MSMGVPGAISGPSRIEFYEWRIGVSDTALVLLDLQNEMVDPRGKIGSGGLHQVVSDRKVLENAKVAIDAARSADMPLVFVRLGFRADYSDALSVAPRVAKLKSHHAAILGSWGTDFPATIAPRADDYVVTKQCVNPFYNTGLLNWLLHRHIRKIVIGGVVTNLVVESTARAADDAGLAVTILEDCCAAPNATWHQFAIENTLPLFGTVTSTALYFGH
jgi:biuret amidohydrolase